ncbi:MAG TPA: ATP-binding protein [Phycisphaerae bacterium]|nr:ATP-binding protein [Phycisphaerae bacterium]HRY69179.1 ATP-binding protein [Phycisphaerae bacterium]HSA26140.1 ATP-binding protein [Phycisphaerae bacterium]
MRTSGAQPVDQPLVLEITSDTRHLAGVRVAVLGAAQAVGFVEPQLSGIALAIDEALTNVIRHGYRGQSGRPIQVTIQPVRRGEGCGIEVTICDCCPQVDPATIMGRDLGDVRPGGLGTHIIRTVMDEVEYTKREPAGMRLRLLKMLGEGGTGPRVGGSDPTREKS